MSQDKIHRIRGQDRQDWSRKSLTGTGIEHLDKKEIQFARDKFLEKTEGPYMADEVKSWTDEEFLAKTKLMINGGVTNAGMLLLGQEQYNSFLPESIEQVLQSAYSPPYYKNLCLVYDVVSSYD